MILVGESRSAAAGVLSAAQLGGGGGGDAARGVEEAAGDGGQYGGAGARVRERVRSRGRATRRGSAGARGARAQWAHAARARVRGQRDQVHRERPLPGVPRPRLVLAHHEDAAPRTPHPPRTALPAGALPARLPGRRPRREPSTILSATLTTLLALCSFSIYSAGNR